MAQQQTMNLDTFRYAMDDIAQWDRWVPSMKRGRTGVEFTLLKLLGLAENKIFVPEIGIVEIKVARSVGGTWYNPYVPTQIQLLELQNVEWQMDPKEAIEKYGLPDRRGRYGILSHLIYFEQGITGIWLDIKDGAVMLRHYGTVIAKWYVSDIYEQFKSRRRALIYVMASTQMGGNLEWFRYDRADLGFDASIDSISREIEYRHVEFRLRLRTRKTRRDAFFGINSEHALDIFGYRHAI